ncbi:uncharacterized protein LOC123676464 isoform X1 [Harmonia axyridis]|uniref:uncharacterized protein LOC123676464 isoform X1 n=1 Tax=Harmonia axyridis TaxID=115357 RepID=UPI001E277F66|nr:uncharacterized protein LOC123676464 isoform X1 [Harmonia axyridis]
MGDSMEIDEIELDDNGFENDTVPVGDDKTIKRRSQIWKYFTPLSPVRAKCNLCRIIFSYKTSISNLKIHLQRKHQHIAVPGIKYKFIKPKLEPSQVIPRKIPRESNSNFTNKKWDILNVKVREENSQQEEENLHVEVLTPAPVKKFQESVQRDSFLFGASDFATIADKSWYVDKTLFIKATLRECDRVLITTPRRCGKSTNIFTLKKFVEIEVNKNGDPINLQVENGTRFLSEQQMSRNFSLFTDKKIFTIGKEKRKIFHKTFFSKHFGKYPVIHINFRNIVGDTYEEVLGSLRTSIYTTFMEHKYLISSRLWDCYYSKATFEKYIDFEQYDKVPEEKLKNSLRYLTELLCVHFNTGSKVYVLIDDLDEPITNIIYNSNFNDYDFKRIVLFIKTLLSNLMKDNPYVERVLAMGTHHYSYMLISESNTIHKPYLHSDSLCSYFGFTTTEVERLLGDFDLSDTFNEVKVWYNSYGMNLTDGDIVEMYNNWSVLQYLYEKDLKKYISLGNFNRIKTVLTRKAYADKIEVLMSRKMITIKYKDRLNFEDVLTLKRIFNEPNFELKEEDMDLFFQFLYEAGFLNMLSRTEESIELGIPNIEIYSDYCKAFFSFNFFKRYYNVTDGALDAFVESIKALSNIRNQESFLQLANSTKNLFQNTKVLPQNDFELQALIHHFLKKYFRNLKGEALTMPKRYLKCDIGLPVDHKLGIIIEVTTYDRSTSLDALNQITSNKFNEILNFDGLNDEVYMGLHLGEDRKITISYLVNTVDLTLADTVCSS